MKKPLLLFLMLFTLNSFSLAQEYKPKDVLITQADKGDYSAMLDLVKYYEFPKTKEGLLHFNKWMPLIERNIGKYDIYKESKVIDLYSLYGDMVINGKAYHQRIKEASLLRINRLFSDRIGLIKFYAKKHRYTQAIYFLKQVRDTLSKKKADKLFDFFSNESEFKKIKLSDEREKILFKLNVFKLNKKKVADHEERFTWSGMNESNIKSAIKLNDEIDLFLLVEKLTKNQDRYRHGYYQEYINLYESGLKLYPDSLHYYTEMYEMYRKLELDEKAVKLLFKILYLNPEASQYIIDSYDTRHFIKDKRDLLSKFQQGRLFIALSDAELSFKDEAKGLAAYAYIDKRIKENDLNAIYYTKMLPKDIDHSRLNKESLQKLAQLNKSPLRYKIIDKAYAIDKCACNVIPSFPLEESIIDLRKEYFDLKKKSRNRKYRSDQFHIYKYLKKSASMGDVASKFYLADFFLDGLYLQYSEAEKILLALEKRGSTRARKKLLALYLDKNYVNQSRLLKAIDILSSPPLLDSRGQLILTDLYLTPHIKQYEAAAKILISLEKNNATSTPDRLISLYSNTDYRQRLAEPYERLNNSKEKK